MFVKKPHSSRRLVLAAVAALGLVGGCSAVSTPGGQNGHAAGHEGEGAGGAPHPALFHRLPTLAQEAGSITVATDPTYPPFESLTGDQMKVVGLDMDLLHAMAHRLGVNVTIQRAGFESLVTGLQAGRYEMAMSAMTDTASREKQVSFVDYFKVGGAVVMAKDDPVADKRLPSALCGKHVGVQVGTIISDLSKRASKACVAAGQPPIRLDNYPSVPAAVLAMSSGRVGYVWTDSVSAATQVKNSQGRFTAADDGSAPEPTGMAFPRTSVKLRDAFRAALQSMIDDGSYRRILRHYGLTNGAVKTAEVDGADD